MRWGEWTNGKREAPEPLEGDVGATVLVGTVVWAALFVAQVPFYGWYADHGHDWFIWTCLVGTGLGLFGLWYARRREAALRAQAARQRDQDD
ncbi:DUF2530 domain-containing protein [Streptomyces sp. NBC_01803]|uniref:DUF2530 domain-containing protein n=1 Tax=Streptomyces sp. NBC_01803 TaxID=2975946 RepID=UPI002DD82B7B|nr:DUF2530 domain-containing protein [Streptomyces sp. NBC_01803]WSA44765.1 DUF2530 domain-containing protein [Streptomyces sp. NBC_01803]